MPNLIRKLNVLVQSSLRDAVSGGQARGRRRVPSAGELGPDIDQEVAALRAHIDAALDDEDDQEAAIAVLRRAIADWDQQADRAVAAGDEVTARHAIRQMQFQQQRLTMAEAELSQHRLATSDLIRRVNELEAVVAEARQRQAQVPEAGAKQPLSARLREARERASAPQAAPVEDVAEEIDPRAVEDDLAARRRRLSQ